MANHLHTDIDRMCMALKHDASDIDHGEIRTLLRRAQAVIDILDSLSFLEGLHVESKEDPEGFRSYHVNIHGFLTREQTDNLLLYVSGHWDTTED